MIHNTTEEEHFISLIYFVDTLLISVYIAVLLKCPARCGENMTTAAAQ
jgi:hypothetical protein